jgi:hypothetical protein
VRRLAVALVLALALVPGLPASPAQSSSNAAYIDKAKTVALDYWTARRPAATCADRPVDVSIVPPQKIGGQWVEQGPIGFCQGPYYPESGARGYIAVSTTARRRSWVVFCTTVIQGWGSLSGLLYSKNPKSVMYPGITRRNVQRKACGHRP